jgi:predicted transcriptional regulator
VRSIEAGKIDPHTWTIKQLAEALGCAAGYLAFGG